MNIYREMEEGAIAIDLDVATSELKATSLIQNDGVRRARMAEISAAALLDIASSLRVLAGEAAAAMLPTGWGVDYFEGDPYSGERIDNDGPRDFLLVGDVVHLVGETEPGDVVSLGFDGDGNATASVNFGDGWLSEYYHSSLIRMVGDEGRNPELLDTLVEAGDDRAGEISDEDEAKDPDLVDLDAGTINHFFVDALGDPETCTDPTHRHPEPGDEPAVNTLRRAADLVDDIDADFGDESHPEAESAVDVLRANEAARKAAKKGKKK